MLGIRLSNVGLALFISALLTSSSAGAKSASLSDSLIRSMALIVVTPDDQFGNVTDDVWFDVGPHAWKINQHVLSRNTSTTIVLAVPKGMRMSDLTEIRVEKKGINGWTGAPEGFVSGHPSWSNRWHPKTLTLFINGSPWRTVEFPQNVVLDRNTPSWRIWLVPLTKEQMFAYNLRDTINPITGHAGELISRFTTYFKALQISGWQPGPLRTDQEFPAARVIGTIEHPPSPGTDGFVSLDVRLQRVELAGSTFIVDGTGVVPRQRFIRVEYCHHLNPWPAIWQRVQIDGRVRWDTDQNGFFEIHPRGPQDVLILDKNGTLIRPQMPISKIIYSSDQCDGL